MPRTRTRVTGRMSNLNITSSVRGRASSNGRTAGGSMQTLGGGRGGQMTSRRKRYYDIRVGLGLAGG